MILVKKSELREIASRHSDESVGHENGSLQSIEDGLRELEEMLKYANKKLDDITKYNE